ncbi:lachesin-like [Pollicipes pollicipes]|uniref:lachesin-like n=1 Tax=Pollicipes pollicipes TaxID=41117 RepID=UPI0018857998|nr:lachesin-like [Pollicipes pollicipes]
MSAARGVCRWALLITVAVFSQVGAKDVDFDYPDVLPVFVTKPAAFSVKEGDTLDLPCQIRELGPYPVVWRKGNRVISAGAVITAIDRRFRLVRGHDLHIERVKVKDTGTFTCSVSTETIMDVTHKVDVLYGPSVTTIPESGLVVAQRGTDVVLECSAEGKPPPTIIWRKQSGRLPSGDETYPGARYAISEVTRQMAGVYECVADNSLGITAVGRISLQVQYPPEVEVESSTVHTGEGYQVKLICFVFADPHAEVVWSRENSQLDPTRHVISEDVVMGTRHILTIRSVQRDDFDIYTCEASNRLGSMKGRMLITGVADRVRITSPPISTAPEDFDLSWEVESYSAIHEYKVAYRRSKFNSTVALPSQFKEVIVPTTGTGPATTYDLYIQASNRHGWNAVSDMFHFSTLSKGEGSVQTLLMLQDALPP